MFSMTQSTFMTLLYFLVIWVRIGNSKSMIWHWPSLVRHNRYKTKQWRHKNIGGRLSSWIMHVRDALVSSKLETRKNTPLIERSAFSLSRRIKWTHVETLMRYNRYLSEEHPKKNYLFVCLSLSDNRFVRISYKNQSITKLKSATCSY